jgi:hypothetical protein
LLNQLPLHSHCLIRWKRRKIEKEEMQYACVKDIIFIHSFFFKELKFVTKFHLPMSLKIMAFIPMRVVDHNLHLHNLT